MVTAFRSLNLHGSKRFSAVVGEPEILRKIDEWACVKGCGACCKLGPLDSRPDLATVSLRLNNKILVTILLLSILHLKIWCYTSQ